MAFNIVEIQNGNMEVFGNKGRINPNKRVLLIGLGGTGTDTLLLTKAEILHRFELADRKLPSNIELLSLDTDLAGKERDGVKLDPNNEFLQLSDNLITANLQDKTRLPKYYLEWINPNLQVPHGVIPGQNGAGAIRQLGRYLLMSNYQRVYDAILQKITNLKNGASPNVVFDVIIFSGISGGTGSGTFIDTGYIVRKVFQDLAIGSQSKQITAYLYLPDVNLGNPNVPVAAHQYIKCNGYAAMKDLDYFMSIAAKKQVNTVGDSVKPYVFTQQYTQRAASKVEFEEPPYDSTYLISGTPSTITGSPDAYEYSINVTADSIINFIAGSDVEGHDGKNMGIQSVDINSAAMQAQQPKIQRPNGSDILANYDYKVLGASAATLPMKEITYYIAGQFLKKVDMLKSQRPEAKDFEEFLKQLGINQMLASIKTKCGSINPGFTGADFKADPAGNDSILRNGLRKYRSSVMTNTNVYASNEVDSLKGRIETALDSKFKDIKYGPFFVNRILADTNNGLISKMTGIAAQLMQTSNGKMQEATKCEAEAKKLFDDANNAVMGKTSKFQAYIDKMCEMVQLKCDAHICRELSELIKNAHSLENKDCLVNYLVKKNKDIFNVYTQILETLAKRFIEDSENAIESRGNGRVFVWNLVNIKEISPQIKESINSEKLDAALNNMLLVMVKNSEKWCSSNSVLNEFGSFLAEEFQAILSNTMDSYIDTIPEADLKRNLERLEREAAVHFPTAGNVNANLEICDKITVPANSPKLKDFIENQFQNITPPVLSNVYEKISWVRVNVGTPIFQYAYLQGYEDAYEATSVGEKVGMHLYENGKERLMGAEYPALLPEYFYNSNYSNDREKTRINEMNATFDAAEKLGIINYETNSAYVQLTKSDWVETEVKSVSDKYKLDIEHPENSLLTLENIINCKNELGVLKDKSVKAGKVCMPDTAGLDVDDRRRMVAKESFSRMPELKAIVNAEIEKFAKIDNAVNTLSELEKSFGTDKEKYVAFAQVFMFDIVKRAGINYTYGEEKITSRTSTLWRYDLFCAFENAIYDVEKNNIQKMAEDMMGSDEGLNKMAAEYDKLVKDLGEEMTKLIQLSDDEQGKAIKMFYNKLRMFVNDEATRIHSFI